MNNALELNIYGIKCDACDYRNSNVKVEEYEKWLNKHCPKCGANLLTEEDFNNVKMLMSFTEEINKILPKRKDDDEIVSMSIEMNGTGDMELNIKKDSEEND